MDASSLGAGQHTLTGVATRADGTVEQFSATFTVAAAAPQRIGLLTASSEARRDSVPVQGRTITGRMYVHTRVEQGIESVDLYLDDVLMQDRPLRVERYRPYSLSDKALESGSLGSGSHSVTAVTTMKTGERIVPRSAGSWWRDRAAAGRAGPATGALAGTGPARGSRVG